MALQAFTDRTTVLSWARDGNPNLSAGDVTQNYPDFGNRKVHIELKLSKITGTIPTSHDSYDLLEMAATCYALEKLNSDGLLRWSTGDVAAEHDGFFRVEYQRWQPMFFFAQGDSRRFNNLLPHETWRMVGNKFVEAFVSDYNQGEGYLAPSLFHDDYKRGYKALDFHEHRS